MKQTRSKPAVKCKPVQQNGNAAADTRSLRLRLALGYTIVAVAVLLGLAESFFPKALGIAPASPAVGIGLAALAGFRLLALWRELRRQQEGLL